MSFSDLCFLDISDVTTGIHTPSPHPKTAVDMEVTQELSLITLLIPYIVMLRGSAG